MRSGSLTARGISYNDLDAVSEEAYYGGSAVGQTIRLGGQN